MTQNQIAYANYKENRRSNLQTEDVKRTEAKTAQFNAVSNRMNAQSNEISAAAKQKEADTSAARHEWEKQNVWDQRQHEANIEYGKIKKDAEIAKMNAVQNLVSSGVHDVASLGSAIVKPFAGSLAGPMTTKSSNGGNTYNTIYNYSKNRKR